MARIHDSQLPTGTVTFLFTDIEGSTDLLVRGGGSHVKLERSTVIDRPPAVVFDFVGTHHVRDHPRWDPTVIELEQLTDGPIGVGTVIADG